MGYQRRVHGKTHKISPSPSSSLHSPHTSYKMTPRVIVVGGGLSGLSAAHTIYLAGGNVVVLDKQGFFGGNSTKATSGINGALTRTQVDSKIQDSVKQFYDDTLKSARDKARPDLIKVLTYKSAAAVEWLQDVFNLDLTLVFAARRSLPTKNTQRTRCEVPGYGHHICIDAKTRGARRERARACTDYQEGPRYRIEQGRK